MVSVRILHGLMTQIMLKRVLTRVHRFRGSLQQNCVRKILSLVGRFSQLFLNNLLVQIIPGDHFLQWKMFILV